MTDTPPTASHDETAALAAIREALADPETPADLKPGLLIGRFIVEQYAARAAADTGAGDEGLRARIEALLDEWAAEAATIEQDGTPEAEVERFVNLACADQLRAALATDTTSPDDA